MSWLNLCVCLLLCIFYGNDPVIGVLTTWFQCSVMVSASASGVGRRGFYPELLHTKDVKNGTSGYLAWRSAL